jgi:hypothetical protein
MLVLERESVSGAPTKLLYHGEWQAALFNSLALARIGVGGNTKTCESIQQAIAEAASIPYIFSIVSGNGNMCVAFPRSQSLLQP